MILKDVLLGWERQMDSLIKKDGYLTEWNGIALWQKKQFNKEVTAQSLPVFVVRVLQNTAFGVFCNTLLYTQA